MLKLFEIVKQSVILRKPELILNNRLIETHEYTLQSLLFIEIVLIYIILNFLSKCIDNLPGFPTLVES